jgi:hypothetical protein
MTSTPHEQQTGPVIATADGHMLTVSRSRSILGGLDLQFRTEHHPGFVYTLQPAAIDELRIMLGVAAGGRAS